MATASKGLFVWYEHLTRDPDAAVRFYSDVVGWKTQPFAQNPGYRMWVGSQGPLGGVMKLPDDAGAVPPHWMGDVMVDDVDASAKLAQKLGGKIMHEPSDIPTVGRFAVIADPQGAVLAIFRPSGSMDLHDPAKDGEFRWSELYTSDVAAAFAFYTELFEWKVFEDMDMGATIGVYRIFGLGSRRLGGIMKSPPGSPMPPTWTYYAGTSDLDGAVARAKKAGAKLLNGPMEVPGGARIAQLLDPQGAMFAIHQGPLA